MLVHECFPMNRDYNSVLCRKMAKVRVQQASALYV